MSDVRIVENGFSMSVKETQIFTFFMSLESIIGGRYTNPQYNINLITQKVTTESNIKLS